MLFLILTPFLDLLELTEKEKKEREKLLVKGFGNWKKTEYNQFIKACAEFGRDNLLVSNKLLDLSVDTIKGNCQCHSEQDKGRDRDLLEGLLETLQGIT